MIFFFFLFVDIVKKEKFLMEILKNGDLLRK